mgnify:CR=1 FL=1
MLLFSSYYQPVLAMTATVPFNVILLIVALLFLALYTGMRSGKPGWPVTYTLAAIVLVICYPDSLSSPIGWFEDIGVSPNAQVVSLMSIAFLLAYILACLRGMNKKGESYLFNKSMWLGGLVAWVLTCNTAAIAILLSLNYDASGDNMLKELNKHQVQVSTTVEFTDEAELLLDDTLSEDDGGQKAAGQNKPIIPLMEELAADITYQPTAPALVLQHKVAEKPQPYVPRSMQPRTVKSAKGDGSCIFTQADYAELKGYIKQLEKRRYIQKRSLKQRARMLELLKEIANGGDVNMQKSGHNGWTALHYASAIGDVNITRWLLNHGADTTKKNKEGQTPIRCIGANNSREIRNLLTKHAKN